ncbi:MAG: hypothetical protein JXD22_02780, partial [Sedimentisphaerales bacterium]|nr:hypothetical protein [Sedimentisphaerales bacterium]
GGGQWRGQLIPKSGDDKGYITYGAYGVGAKPVLLGSVSRNDPADWQQEEGGIWSTVPPVFSEAETICDLGARTWLVHREGQAEVGTTVLAAKENAGAVYRLECTQRGETGNQIQLFARQLPVKKGEYYQFRFRARCDKAFVVHPGNLVLMKQDPPWSGYGSCEFAKMEMGSEWCEYSVRFRASVTAQDGRITFFLGNILPGGAAFFFEPGELKRLRCSQAEPITCDVGNIILDEGESVGVKKWGREELKQERDYWYDGTAGLVRMRCRANPAKLYRSIELALCRHIIDQSGCSYVAYDGLALRYGAAHGIGGGNIHHIRARNCDISYIGGGHQLTRADGHPVRYGNGIEFWGNAHDCLVERCRLWEIYDAALTNQNNGPNVQQYRITYRQNVIWNSEYSFEYWNRPENSRTHHICFENNTCVKAGYGWGHGQRPDPSGRHLCFYSSPAPAEEVSIRNNIFFEAKGNAFYAPGWSREALRKLVMGHNCWYQTGGVMINLPGQGFGMEQFVEYQKEWGQEEHSICVNPLLVNVGGGDFHLRSESGCVDAGAEVGLTKDFEGVSIPQGTGADIGAYEFERK